MLDAESEYNNALVEIVNTQKEGELVITVGGSGARVGEKILSVPIDATVVAIVDEKKLFIEKGKEHV